MSKNGMGELIVSKWVCINRSDVNKDLLTEGKVYEITKDISICPVTVIDLSHTSFIADNGRSYLIDLNNENDFITLEEYRQRQLDKLL
jgi:hypothetical protein